MSIYSRAIAWAFEIDRFISGRVRALHHNRSPSMKIQHSWQLFKLGITAYACYLASSFTMHSPTNPDASFDQKMACTLTTFLIVFYLWFFYRQLSKAERTLRKGVLHIAELHTQRKGARIALICLLAASCAVVNWSNITTADMSFMSSLLLWIYGDYVLATV